MNIYAIRVIYKYEMLRAFETIAQSFASPVISTALYFVVFGSAIGSRIESVEGVSYGAFIVPGLMMLALLTQSISNASFGIFFPRFTGTVYDIDYEKSVILMDDGKVIVVFNKETRFVLKNGRFESTVDASRVESGMTATVLGKKEADSIIYAETIEIELEMRLQSQP